MNRLVIATALSWSRCNGPGVLCPWQLERSHSGRGEQGSELLLVRFECRLHLRKMLPPVIDTADPRLRRDVPENALRRRVVAAAPLGELRPDRAPDVVQRPFRDA